MRKFAGEFGFSMRHVYNTPDPNNILFELRRMDIDIIGANDAPPDAPQMKFGTGIYPAKGRPSPSLKNTEPVFEGLKLFVGVVPGASFSERR